MKTRVIAKSLKQSLAVVKAAAVTTGKEATVPLNCVMLSAVNNKLILKCTNLELTILSTVEAEVFEQGDVLVKVESLEKLLKTMKDTDITITGKEDSLIIENESQSRNMQTYDPEIFPKTETDEGPLPDIVIQGTLLTQILDKTVYAARPPSDITRPEFNCIHLEKTSNTVVFAATDGIRLARNTLPVTELSSKSDRCFEGLYKVQHIKTLGKIAKGTFVSFYDTEDRGIFRVDNHEIIIRKVIGRFPDTAKVLGKESEFDLKINTKAFINTLKTLLPIAKHHQFKKVKFEVNIDRLILSSQQFELGEASEIIPLAEEARECNFITAFNVEYLLQILNSIESKDVRLLFTNIPQDGLYNDMIYVESVDDKCSSYEMDILIMPLRTKK